MVLLVGLVPEAWGAIHLSFNTGYPIWALGTGLKSSHA